MHRAFLVDSNVLIDVLSEDTDWFDCSSSILAWAANHGIVAIDPIIYAEVSIAFDTIEALEAAVPRDAFPRRPLPLEAAFLAGKAFVRYRRAGGAKHAPLPDFYIGAHAAVERLTLLTRDASRYRTYFPGLSVIAPDA